MEPLPDGDFLVYDLEQEHAHVPLQRDLLVGSLQAIPELFLGWRHPLGREEPRWVLRVPAPLDTSVATRVRYLCLEDPVYLAALGESWRREADALRQVERRLRDSLISGAISGATPSAFSDAGPAAVPGAGPGVAPSADPAAAPPDWQALARGLARTGAFAAFNWLVPAAEMASRVAELLSPGESPLGFLVPTGLPLSLRVERAQLLFAYLCGLAAGEGDGLAGHRVRYRKSDLRRWYALDWGCLVHEPLETAPAKRAAEMERHMDDLESLTPPALAERWAALRSARARRTRTIEAHLGLLEGRRAARLPSRDLLWVSTALRFLRLVVDQEEERHILRSRGFALLEALMEQFALDPAKVDLGSLPGASPHGEVGT